MLHTPKWKLFLVTLICLLSIYISIPSLFPSFITGKMESFFPKSRLNLGLDLRGGGYMLLELDFSSYAKEQIQKSLELIRVRLKNGKINADNFSIDENKIKFSLLDPKQYNDALKAITDSTETKPSVDKVGENQIVINIGDAYIKSKQKDLIVQTMEIVRRRLDETGTKELDIQRQGDNYIVVQVPGLKDPKEIKNLLGKTAKLSFHLVEEGVSISEAFAGNLPAGTKILPMEEKGGQAQYIIIQSRSVLTGEMLVDAQVTVDLGMPKVSFKFNNIGAKLFGEVTAKQTGKRFAIVLDNKVISAPVINEPILGGSGVISGNFTVASANELALLLRAGALPVPLKIVEERTIGPSLGEDSINKGTTAAVIGTVMVIIFMILFYGLFGVFADIALIFNLFLMVAILALFGATLTLPGIAGMVLTLGMAVDANVLICERIREEISKGRTPLSAIEAGYSLAYNTILDSNLTTILVGVILYVFGNGPVKGFAVALTVGIMCSMFTAVALTKIIVGFWYRRARPKLLPL